jgi:hypothetical protein
MLVVKTVALKRAPSDARLQRCGGIEGWRAIFQNILFTQLN